MSFELLSAIEAAAVRGWPALETREIDGWLWRYASGGSIRANSVAALTWTGRDLAAAVAACEAAYRAKGAPCVFTVSEVSQPQGLDQVLAERGYARGDDHVTMAKALSGVSAPLSADVSPAPSQVPSAPSEAWLRTYLSGLSPDRQGIARRLIANLPTKARFISDQPGGSDTVSSTGLTISDGQLASVQCMATEPQRRRNGGATRVLATIEALASRDGVSHLYLQTGGDNTAAQALYARFGFVVVGRYHTRHKPM
jgi:N-acetylglutamate synthase